MSEKNSVDVIDRFINFYNSGDDEKLIELCDENILVVHHNRGVEIQGKSAFKEVLKAFKKLLPDKQFYNRRGVYHDHNHVVVEHSWTAKAEEDVPGFAKAGELVNLDLCTCYTLKNGLVREYHDYG